MEPVRPLGAHCAQNWTGLGDPNLLSRWLAVGLPLQPRRPPPRVCGPGVGAATLLECGDTSVQPWVAADCPDAQPACRRHPPTAAAHRWRPTSLWLTAHCCARRAGVTHSALAPRPAAHSSGRAVQRQVAAPRRAALVVRAGAAAASAADIEALNKHFGEVTCTELSWYVSRGRRRGRMGDYCTGIGFADEMRLVPHSCRHPRPGGHHRWPGWPAHRAAAACMRLLSRSDAVW